MSTENIKDINKDRLNILWTSGDPITGENMVFMYAINSIGKEWWKEVRLILWGASVELTAKDKNIQNLVRIALENGVEVTACQGCVTNLGHKEAMEALNIDVKYWGEGLTEILKTDEKLITI